MKKLFIVLFAAAAVTACKQNTKTAQEVKDVAQADSAAATYVVDPAMSQLAWTASKVTATHHGKVSIKEGTLSVQNGQITAGNFVVDMKTFTNEDIKDTAYKAKFLGHIAGEQFFMVDKYPTATFEISSVTPQTDDKGNTHKIAGNLTIKGEKHGIEFPANIAMGDNELRAKGKITINRNEWGIIWGGKEDKDLMNNMRDDVISNMIEFDVHIVAKKQ